MKVVERGREIKQTAFNTLNVGDLFLIGTETCIKLEDCMYLSLIERVELLMENKYENVGSIDQESATISYNVESY